MSPSTTFVPSDANAIAHAAPMPLAAPDISVTSPFSLLIDIFPDSNFHYGVSFAFRSRRRIRHVRTLSGVVQSLAPKVEAGKAQVTESRIICAIERLSICRLRATFPFKLLGQLQHLQRLPSSNHRQHPSHPAQPSLRRLEDRSGRPSLTFPTSSAVQPFSLGLPT